MKNLVILLASLCLVIGCSDPASDNTSTPDNQGNQSDSNGKADTTETGDSPEATPPAGGEVVDESATGGTATEPVGGSEEPAEIMVDPIDGNTDPVDGEEPVEEIDPYADARDVTKHKVVFADDVVAESYSYPSVSTGFGLGGTEFWQKWAEGHNPTYSFSEGTAFGKRCMLASAIRFQAIMAEPPEALIRLRDDSKWSGRFFNWNDDYSQSEWGDGRSARLWAWRTSLVKWISQTNQDGSCYLPTLEHVEALAENCTSYSNRRDGEIQGCTN